MTMTSNPDNPTVPAEARWPKWLRVTVSGVLGGLVGYGSVKLLFMAMPDLPGPPNLGWPQIAATMFAAISLVVGIIVLAMSASRRFYDLENASEEAGPEEHRRVAPGLRLAGIAILAMAAEFGALAMPPERSHFPIVFAVIALSLLVQGWTSWRIWQNGDELERAVTLEASTLAIGLVLLILSLWAPLALYGFVPFDPLAVLVVVTLAVIAPTIWLTVRRGLGA